MKVKRSSLMSKTKPALHSLGLWGSIGSIGSIIALWNSIPPELFEETQALFLVVSALVSQVLALVGRWRAIVPIKGLFR